MVNDFPTDGQPEGGPASAPASPTRARDIYGRKPISGSRGKTQDHIMQLQRAAGSLPGSGELLADAPAGSIGEGMLAFLVDWVEPQPVTSRRAYERALVLLLKDLVANGPAIGAPASELTLPRLAAHLAWRVDNGLDHPGELLRTAVHLTRLGDWLDEHRDAAVGATRDDLRAVADSLIPPN